MKNWIPEIFELSLEGVSTAIAPEALGPLQVAWARNVAHRGGKAHTRPTLVQRLVLPSGRHQGTGFFSVQDGMLISSIAGRLYRIRVGNTFSHTEIPLASRNNQNRPKAWMLETVGSFIVQDGESAAIIYDGSTARRADPTRNEIPRGRFMAYGNGRVWLAINDNELVAGNIKQKDFQSELVFTETQYLQGGGAFYFPGEMRGLAFLPISGGTGQGGLVIACRSTAELLRADVTYRDLWAQIPGFITTILHSTGSVNHESICAVNNDLYMRDSEGGVRSLTSAIADESTPGNAPLSQEISRITDFESQKHLKRCSSIYFDKRLIMTASPFLVGPDNIAFKHLAIMDCAPLASMRGKARPIWEGDWEGLPFAQVVKGEFNGRARAFVISSDGTDNRLFEIVHAGSTDVSTVSSVQTSTPVRSYVEYGRRNFNDPKRRKALKRADVYLSDIEGEVVIDLYWRADHEEQWRKWDGITARAKTTDPGGVTPHAWKNIRPGSRTQIRSFTIPEDISADTGRAYHTGIEFQFRLVWSGHVKIHRLVAFADMLEDTTHANRDEFSEDWSEHTVSNNDIHHVIPT